MQEINEKEMDGILFILRSDEVTEESKKYFLDKVLSRLDYLEPLVCEITHMRLELKDISLGLFKEYEDLHFIRKKFIL